MRTLLQTTLCLLLLLMIGWIGRAEEGFTRAVIEAQYPAPVRTMELDAGYRLDLATEDAAGYLRLVYLGVPVTQQGIPITAATHIDLAAPVIPEGLGDRYQVALTYERGKTDRAGSLISAEGVIPLPWQLLGRYQLRGTAYLAANLTSDDYLYAAGLESPPIRIPLVGAHGWSNWAVVGANLQSSDQAGQYTATGLLTGRAFCGKAFGWRAGNPDATAAIIADALLGAAPDYAAALALEEEVQAIPAGERTALQQLFLDAIIETEQPDAWAATIQTMARGHAGAITTRPSAALYGEVTAWAPLGAGGDAGALATLTFDWWLIPGRDDLFMRARYERGDDRATGETLNQLLVTTALRF